MIVNKVLSDYGLNENCIFRSCVTVSTEHISGNIEMVKDEVVRDLYYKSRSAVEKNIKISSISSRTFYDQKEYSVSMAILEEYVLLDMVNEIAILRERCGINSIKKSYGIEHNYEVRLDPDNNFTIIDEPKGNIDYKELSALAIVSVNGNEEIHWYNDSNNTTYRYINCYIEKGELINNSTFVKWCDVNTLK